ncbi:deubiquitinase OTUD6B [Anticarsia gemmatalis]|uniref:deubiquitinase OTUD6B n=1 Tax=Anticarsia gemmatalis TaxID=129554 RepID=UPI003F771093
MDNDTDDLAVLETRHRKEKKELQAQIQAMKKTAKNDKTKKKELTTEIARLENEMDIRHKQEIEAIQAIQKDPVEVTEQPVTDETESTKQKVSKAQKRREKKSQQDKERENQIKQQEQENRHGPRNIEQQAINARLKGKGLRIFTIPSDGDCLYKAIAHQMAIRRQQEISVDNLRKSVADYIRLNKDDFIPFMSNPDTFEMLTDDEFQEYCDKIENTKVWGGQLEIRALSNCLKCPITIIQATGPEAIEQGVEFEGPALNITYHRHMYRLGEHYNSTVQVHGEENN